MDAFRDEELGPSSRPRESKLERQKGEKERNREKNGARITSVNALLIEDGKHGPGPTHSWHNDGIAEIASPRRHTPIPKAIATSLLTKSRGEANEKEAKSGFAVAWKAKRGQRAKEGDRCIAAATNNARNESDSWLAARNAILWDRNKLQTRISGTPSSSLGLRCAIVFLRHMRVILDHTVLMLCSKVMLAFLFLPIL